MKCVNTQGGLESFHPHQREVIVPTQPSFEKGIRHYVMVLCKSINLPPSHSQFSKWPTIVGHS